MERLMIFLQDEEETIDFNSLSEQVTDAYFTRPKPSKISPKVKSSSPSVFSTIESNERLRLKDALIEYNGNCSKSVMLLNMSITTFGRKTKKI